MSRITISGTGAVSSAGWGVRALVGALETGGMPELSELRRVRADGGEVATKVARVPVLPDRSLLPASGRLRRVSPIAKFAAAAALEAMGPGRIAAAQAGEIRVGVICTLMNGCVNYSNRFFGEVLKDPAMASPILFPETVYNAPSSHLSALIGSTAANDTLVGDAAEFFTGMEMAAEWLLRGDCDLCLLVAPEEIDWLSAEAMGLYSKGVVPSEGAAALVMERDGEGVELRHVPDPVSYAEVGGRTEALRKWWSSLAVADDGRTLLADGRTGVKRRDRAEDELFEGWAGPRVSARAVLGDALCASTGLQVVAAVEWLARGRAERAVVAAVGGNEQVAGCVLGRGGR